MLVKRSIAVAIAAFWCFMNAWLIKREWSAPPKPLALRSVETVTERIDEWWGVYYRGEKIGYANQTIAPKSQGYEVQDHSILRLQLLGTTQLAITRLHMEVDPEWALQRFDFELQSNGVKFRARGRVTPGKLHLGVESGGHITERDLTLTQTPYLLAALKPYVATQQLEPGKEYHFATFDPATLAQQVTTIVIEGREHIQLNGRREPAIRVRQRFKGLSVVSWLDGTGRTLKEETPAGLALVQQPRHQAETMPHSTSVPLDLITQTSIPTDSPIAAPESKNQVTLKLSGINLANFPMVSTGRQRLTANRLRIEREDMAQVAAIRLPVRDRALSSFTQPTPFLQSDHPRIRSLAREILGREKDARTAVLLIKNWVAREIAKEPTVSIPNALEVLATRKGDCNEHTVLFNALARAVGIPAKTVVGVVYLRGAFYYHAWSEVWLGQWISVDAVLDQFPADATHVKFLEGDIDRQIDILQLIGTLTIQVVEAS